MLTRILSTAVIGTALALTTVAPVQAADTYKIDPSHAAAVFKVKHIGYSNTWGRFNDVSGTVRFDKADPSKSKVTVLIKTGSVDTNHKARDKHLRSADFFNTKEFPEMKFVSTKIEKTGDKTANVTGNLTLLGVTKPVTLAVTWNREAPHFRTKKITTGFSATAKIKRSTFGMKKFLPGIGDDISLMLDIEAIKQ